MDISPAFFFVFASIAIAASLFVVLRTNPVASAFSLVLVFFCFAGIYAMMGAHLVAALQILVYTGAVMVLFIFVIMLLNADVPKLEMDRVNPVFQVLITVAGACGVGFLVGAFQNSKNVTSMGFYPADRVAELGGNTKVLSGLMFSEYILPFELTSILLIAAIVGVVAIAIRNPGRKRKGAR